MPSTNKTPNLGLPQWELTDKPRMEDFNGAFQTIDTEIAAIGAGMADKVNLREENISLYIAKTGSDNTGDGSVGSPFLTINKAIQHANKYYRAGYRTFFYISPGTYNERIRLFGNCSYYFEATSGNKDDTIIDAGGDQEAVGVYDGSFASLRCLTLKASPNSGGSVITAAYGASLRTSICRVTRNGGTGNGFGIFAHTASQAYVSDIEINNTVGGAVCAAYGSLLSAANLSGSGNTLGYAANQSLLFRVGTTVQATTMESKIGAGQIFSA